ncbi:MAG TPA: hypothetical protein PKJ62_05035 [Bacteroidia bacterium]|nr:hypothetical protein [Bacteroidia bacterium]HNS12857.1 hypothetical protein [Bacteroidia bacterium]
MQKIALFIVLITCFFSELKAQTEYAWWNDKHQWDGHTSWIQYMTMSTSFMGPNALPVPEVRTGALYNELEVEQLLGAHFSKGDKTQDFFSRLYVPISQGKVALEAFVVPFELYSMDTTTRDQRAARTRSGEGNAGGDIYFATHVQILQDKEAWPDIALELSFRTASGTRLSDARYTDGSGYYMDLSFGKSFALASEKNIELRVFAMGGFYSYQTYDELHLQNDAFLGGGGIALYTRKISFMHSISGYRGYLNIGDRPMVYKTAFQWKHRKLDAKIWYQWGLNDFPYQSVRFGVVYHLPIRG